MNSNGLLRYSRLPYINLSLFRSLKHKYTNTHLMKDKHWNHIARWTLLTVPMYGQPPRSLWFLFSSHDHPYIHVYVNICIIQSHQGQCGLCLVPMTFSWDRWYSVQNNTTDVDQIIILHTQLEAPPFDRYSYIAMTVQLYTVRVFVLYSMYMEFADIDWIGGDYGGDYTDHGSVMRSCPILAAVSSGRVEPLLIAKQNKTLININKKKQKKH